MKNDLLVLLPLEMKIMKNELFGPVTLTRKMMNNELFGVTSEVEGDLQMGIVFPFRSIGPYLAVTDVITQPWVRAH